MQDNAIRDTLQPEPQPEMNDADKAAAKAKAESILVQVRKTPADFAKLAKGNSQDPGSAAKGGDLGFFTAQKMVKPFADAAFAMKTGDEDYDLRVSIMPTKYGGFCT